jgi:replicative DNA helicase
MISPAVRIPAHNLEAERAVLGSVLRECKVLDDVIPLISAEDFYVEAHRIVFAAALSLWRAGKTVDLVTLAEELKASGQIERAGGYEYLGRDLRDAAPAPASAPAYAAIMREKALLRRLAYAAEETLRDAYEPWGPAQEVIEAAERRVFAITEEAVTGEVADAAQSVAEVFDHIDACKGARGAAGVLKTGLIDLDHLTGGLHTGSLVLWAARPSVGKTSLAAGVALGLILEGHPVLFASLEQTRKELMERMMCYRARVDSHALREGLLDADELLRLRLAGDEIRGRPLMIDHGGRQTVVRIATNARRMKRRLGLAAVFIDYLQLVEPSDRKLQRYEQVGEISRGLKALAKELSVPVVAMCQLNRSPEARAENEPRLSDLRESGSLEMDADCVALLSRSEQEHGVVRLNVAKNRNGPTGEVKLVYQPQFTRFENYACGLPPSG